jgi:hypothetical protein
MRERYKEYAHSCRRRRGRGRRGRRRVDGRKYAVLLARESNKKRVAS